MNLDEIRARLYSSTGMTPVPSGASSAEEDKIYAENKAKLAAYPGYTALDKMAMDFMKQGYNVEDPTKTMKGLLGTLTPALTDWGPFFARPRIATQVAMNVGLVPKTEETKIPGIIALLAGSYTDRIQDYLDKFQDLPDIRAAAEKVTEEEEVPWT